MFEDLTNQTSIEFPITLHRHLDKNVSVIICHGEIILKLFFRQKLNTKSGIHTSIRRRGCVVLSVHSGQPKTEQMVLRANLLQKCSGSLSNNTHIGTDFTSEGSSNNSKTKV
ncbi:hypothetical protein NE237_010665 [Protea cynaroides]|uniref:Uncharacterized protein n=1 Tax=Protea cynaroides TaxID=273540 RepID=A0A9Q0R1F6_9MAGN|nr:hypothetical protein NE237_010665 [Protea cynaroides]